MLVSNRYKKLAQTALFSRMLLNLVAEAHFPLSCGELYNTTYVDGDQGGKKMKIWIVEGGSGSGGDLGRREVSLA